VVFNGCIYNHRELRAELQRAGHVFSTDHSDTEVLVHGWREWNLDLCAALDGMFAFALWDARNATVTIARDYAGEKPLYVAGLEDIYPSDNSEAWAGTLAFASTPAGLFHLCTKLGRELPVNKTVLHWLHNGYARFCAPVDEFPVATISDIVSYRNHKKPTSIIPRGWPETLATHVRSPRNIRLTTDDTDHLLNDVIVSRLSADVPLGCFLSGGVDSSLVAHYAKAALGEVHTFTVRMPDARYDESAVAQRVAAILGTRHETLDTNPDPTADLQSLITQLGLPFGDSSLLPTYWVSRATRNHVKVALTGDGADELFGGYERQLAARWLPLARRLALFFPRRSFDSPDPKSRRHKVHRLFEAALGWQYADLAAITPARLLHRLLGTDINPLTSWSKITYYGGPEIEEAMNHDFRHYLPGDILRKTDTASMSVALEARAPFLALDTIRAARAAPIASLMPHGQRKGLLRQVARKYLPPEIVDRPKMGFAIPIGEWFRSDYGGLRTMLLDHLNSTEPFGPPSLGIDLNMKFIRQMLDEHLGTGPSGRVVRDHSQRLYMLLVLSIWAKWLGGLGKSA
jgi:asparagine synthase (glutamine-hydrolysing)